MTATSGRALAFVGVAEVAKEGHHVAADREEVVARLGRIVVVALPVEVRVGCISILRHVRVSPCFVIAGWADGTGEDLRGGLTQDRASSGQFPRA